MSEGCKNLFHLSPSSNRIIKKRTFSVGKFTTTILIGFRVAIQDGITNHQLQLTISYVRGCAQLIIYWAGESVTQLRVSHQMHSSPFFSTELCVTDDIFRGQTGVERLAPITFGINSDIYRNIETGRSPPWLDPADGVS